VDDVPDDIVSDLVDLTDLDLGDLAAIDDPVLARAIERVWTEVPGSAISGFTDSL
jgi:FXSXX-COOH protein